MEDWLQDALFGAKRAVSPMELSFVHNVPLSKAQEALKAYYNDNSSRLTAAVVLLKKTGLVYCDDSQLESIMRSSDVEDWHVACVSPSDASAPTVFLDSLARVSDEGRTRPQEDLAKLGWLINPELPSNWCESDPVGKKESGQNLTSKNGGDQPVGSKMASSKPKSTQQNSEKKDISGKKDVKNRSWPSKESKTFEQNKNPIGLNQDNGRKSQEKTSAKTREEPKPDTLFVDDELNNDGPEDGQEHDSDGETENLLGELGEEPADSAAENVSTNNEPMVLDQPVGENQNSKERTSSEPQAKFRKVKKVVKYQDSEGYDVEEERWVDEPIDSGNNGAEAGTAPALAEEEEEGESKASEAQAMDIDQTGESKKAEIGSEKKPQPRPQPEKTKKQKAAPKQQKTLLSFFGKK